jgi:hypothetical protein
MYDAILEFLVQHADILVYLAMVGLSATGALTIYWIAEFIDTVRGVSVLRPGCFILLGIYLIGMSVKIPYEIGGHVFDATFGGIISLYLAGIGIAFWIVCMAYWAAYFISDVFLKWIIPRILR